MAYCRDEPAAQELLQTNGVIREYFEVSRALCYSNRRDTDKNLYSFNLYKSTNSYFIFDTDCVCEMIKFSKMCNFYIEYKRELQ